MERSPGSMEEAGAGGGTSQGAKNKRDHHFHWSQQDNRVLEQLRALYSDQEGVGIGLGVETDVVLFGSDGGFVEAHKMVLALCSPYFQDLFTKISQAKSPKQKDGPAVVVLANVTSSQLKHLIQFIYTGEAVVCSDQMEDFLETGSAFKIDGIMYSTTDPSHFPTTTFVADKDPDLNSRTALGSDIPPPYSSLEGQESLMNHEDMSYGSYPVKMELISEGHLVLEDTTSLEHEQDPLAPDFEDESVSREDQDNLVKVDPKFEVPLPTLSTAAGPKRKKVKRKRKLKTISKFSEATLSKTSRKSNPPIVWKRQEPLSDAMLKMHWSVRRQNHCKNLSSVYFYCRVGKHRCPCQLKRTTNNRTGTVSWENNSQQHSHPPTSIPTRKFTTTRNICPGSWTPAGV